MAYGQPQPPGLALAQPQVPTPTKAILYTAADLEQWTRATGVRTYFSIPPRPVALTFDDGPDPEGTPRILAALRSHGVRATFFMLGRNVTKYPHVARQVHQGGHDIGNHSYDHPLYPDLEPDAIRDDMRRCKRAIRQATGVFQPIFRVPYGVFDEKTLRVAAELDYRYNIHWTVHSHDDEEGITPDVVLANATTAVSPGYIVLSHAWSRATAEALPRYLDWLKENGFQPVTITEMLYTGGQFPPSRRT